MEKPSVIISDLHGHIQKLISVLMHYGNEYQYIFNGDVVDGGPDTKSTLEVIRSMGSAATVLHGNHEWVTLAALTDADEARRTIWRDNVWLHPHTRRGYENRTLESYGITTDQSNEYLAKSLEQRMYDTGHLELLESASTYYETDELLVVHAGLIGNVLWDAQKSTLDAVADEAKAHTFMDEPRQLFDSRLSRQDTVPRDTSHRTLITGHSHNRNGAANRIQYDAAAHPARIKLASHLSVGDPLFVYETDSQQITTF